MSERDWPAMNHRPYGRWATAIQDWEDGEGPYLVQGHDRRAYAALCAIVRDEREIMPHQIDAKGDIHKIWVVFHESCGCTPEEHAEHVDGTQCSDDCEFFGLPPCGDLYAWTFQKVTEDVPGALPALELYP